MSNKLTKIATDILIIESDLPYRFTHNSENSPKIDDFEIHIFEQTWNSTALGFGGVGGQQITTAYTYVFIPITIEQNCFVYFSGRFAYEVPYSETFIKDVYNHDVKSVRDSVIYKKECMKNCSKD